MRLGLNLPIKINFPIGLAIQACMGGTGERSH